MLRTVFLLLLSFNVLADSKNKSMVCPAITSEASTIINSIQALKNQLKTYDECKDLPNKLELVSKIMTGKEWVKVKETMDAGESFEVDQLKNISDLTQQASFALNDVVSQISNKRRCVDDKSQASFMAKLSGVVKEVSTVIGTVAGPYGMAVTMGGTLISSAITGIDKFYKSQHPYNFSKKDDEILFVNQFCAYTEVLKDMNDYVNMVDDDRAKELEALEAYLKIKQSDLENNCPECKAQVIAWKANEKADLILNRIKEDAKIVELGKDQDNVDYSRCNGIHQAIYSTNSDLNQFFKLLSTYENPMSSASDASYLTAVVDASKVLPNRFPKLAECWSLPSEEKKEISHTYNNFLRDEILPLGNIFFGQQANGFKIRANKKYNNPLGDYTERTLMRRKWIYAEQVRVKNKIEDPNYEYSSTTINTFKKDLQQRIFSELFVDYLKFQVKRSVKQVKKFEKSYQNFLEESIKEHSTLFGKSVTSVDEILKEFDQRPNLDNRLFLSQLRSKKTDLDIAITHTKTIDRYCHFMNYMMITNEEATAMCVEAKVTLTEKFEQLSKLDKLTKDHVAKKLTWLVLKKETQTSRVKDFAIMLQEWLDEGDRRWILNPHPEDR